MGNGTEGNLRVLGGFDDAEKQDMINSKFFSPETNLKYILTFAPLPGKLPADPNAGWELVEKDMPDFNDKTKTTRKVCLQLHIDSVNGEKVDQEWGVLAKNLRDLFKAPCMNGNLLKKKFEYQSKGEGRSKTYSLSEIGDR